MTANKNNVTRHTSEIWDKMLTPYIHECNKWNNDWEKFKFRKLKDPIFLTFYDICNTPKINHMNH